MSKRTAPHAVNGKATTIAEKVKQIVSDSLGVNESEITADAHLADDLGADSIDLVELVVRCEEEFKIAIPDEDADGIKKFSHLVDVVRKHAPSTALP